jgi:hypothetical protein
VENMRNSMMELRATVGLITPEYNGNNISTVEEGKTRRKDKEKKRWKKRTPIGRVKTSMLTKTQSEKDEDSPTT